MHIAVFAYVLLPGYVVKLYINTDIAIKDMKLLVVKREASTSMFRKIILYCILPVIIGVPFIGQYEANEISDVYFHREVLTAVSTFYWLSFSDYSQVRSIIFDREIAYAKHYLYIYYYLYRNYHNCHKHLVESHLITVGTDSNGLSAFKLSFIQTL